ncbi:hypothetical protein GPECTOR_1g469 [Gonium pectorale]|uniref:Uncharacterized protein n=1 Tax=Gonium pectorale TaxID=33097 RepID=A0A150H3E2_GONPE|nr:hypothetical protein GPECTOR_1g469 [Gonium pectorale]|eukprot:KXZ56522.1 hypothetical protein GPECTOR_1g469 [Gonium pectorale]
MTGSESLQRTSTSGWPAWTSVAGQARDAPVAPASATTSTTTADVPPLYSASLAGSKRRSCVEASDGPGAGPDQPGPGPGPDAAEPSSGSGAAVEPPSPSSSFASFAAALAAHYFADYGRVPDVPTHLEEMRQRGSKRQRRLSVEGAAET